MGFEFDPKKSQENRKLHGIDFIEAQALWLDPMAILGPADSRTEERYLFVGTIGEAVWSAVITLRGPNVRIISVRRARKEEKQVYEDQ